MITNGIWTIAPPSGIHEAFAKLADEFTVRTSTVRYGCDMKLSTILLIGLASACASVPVALVALPPAEAWEIGPWARGRNYSVGMPANPSPGPGGTLFMDFPIAGAGQVDALTTAVGPLAGARQITLTYRVDAARGTSFVADELPNEPATISLYFQRAGDNWSSRGRSASNRWYSPGHAVVPLRPGRHTITVGLDETWTNVNGTPNNQDPDGFEAALQNTARIGMAFGSPSRRSHGVYATGPARFTLLNWDIR